MKRLLLCCIAALAMLLPKTNLAQMPDTNNIQGLLQYIMQPLNKTEVTTGYLEEYGLPAIPFRHYNGNVSDTNIVELNLLRLLYFQLYSSYCQTGSNPMTSISTINSTILQNNKPDSATPIALLVGQYNSVKSNAFNSNLLSYNTGLRQVFDVPGRTQSPYETKRLFAAAPGWQYSTTGTENFVFKPNMVWGNTGLTVTQLQVNFQNGEGFKTLPVNTPVTVIYADTGYYKWTIKATLSDNSIMQCYAEYFVLQKQSVQQRYTVPNIVTPSWGTIAPVSGVHSGGTISIVYSNKQRSNTLRKPLIIAENMDANGIAPSLQREPYRVENFIRSLDGSRPNYDFNNQIDDIAGYDLVFINFNDGVDAIERNAAVVTEAILRVNTNKVFDTRSNRREQNVVLGMGTGGLNARYALAQYTKANATTQNPNPTETRLLITHDAPHRGQNIALGLQHLSRMLGSFSYFGITSRDIFPDYNETLLYLNAPVNQQTLIYRATSDNTNTTNTFINSIYQPMVNYNAPYRFVPTSLGNECANQLFTAGRKFMDFEQGAGTGLKMKVALKLSLFSINLFTVPLLDLKYECAVGAASIPLQTQSFREVARLKTVFKILLFGLIQIDKTGYDKQASASNTYLPVDGVPGSINTILDFQELRNYQSGIGNWYFSQDQFLFEIPIKKLSLSLKFYAFVKAYQYNSGIFTTQYTALPVGSALDVAPFDAGSFNAKFVNGTNPNYPSPASTYIAQASVPAQSLYNNASMRFTARNARFLFNEMEELPNTENCSVECFNAYKINGDENICSSSSIYFIPGLQRGATVTWSVSPSNLVTTTVSNNRLTVQRIGSTNGLLTITATITGGCNSPYTETRDVVVGTQRPSDYSICGYDPNDGCRYPKLLFSVHTIYPVGYTFNWYINNVLTATTSLPYWTYNLPPPCDINIEVSVIAVGPCGPSYPAGEVIYFACEGGSGRNGLRLSPNPSTGIITAELTNKTSSIQQVRITDKTGNIKSFTKKEYKVNKATIDISNLPADIYYISVFDGTKWIKGTVIKN